MKIILFYAVLTLFFSCQRKQCDIETQSINKIELERRIFDECHLDSSKILYPTGIFSFQDYLILMEPKNNPVLSFWTLDSLKYLFSSGYKGGGPNELIRPRDDYFASSDSTFFLFDSDIEREIKVTGKSISIRSNTPIMILDAINQLVHLDSCSYVMGGHTTGEGKEHIRYKNGEYSDFGTYPLDNLEGMEKVALNLKFTAGREGKKGILDFYMYQNLIRMYDLNGSLTKEIRLDVPDHTVRLDELISSDAHVFHKSDLVSNEDFIYILYYGGTATTGQVYSENSPVIPEVQVWSWEGKLVRRLRFDQPFRHFTVAKNGKLYALSPSDADNPYIVYVYDLSK